ncbi:MAG: KilA-N domain-containing protein [Myroides sp.]
MKTNQIIIRPMGNFSVSQRTSDGMFNATELLKQWNENSGSKKDIGHFFENSTTKEFIQAIIDDESKSRNSEKISLSDIYTKRKGINGGTWMHPLLFIDFAMWLNPKFKVQVLRFVYDQLIKFRNEAGDSYKEMCSEISQIVNKGNLQSAIQCIAKGINFNVYGEHEPNIRNLKAE